MGVNWKDMDPQAQERLYKAASPEAKAAIDAARGGGGAGAGNGGGGPKPRLAPNRDRSGGPPAPKATVTPAAPAVEAPARARAPINAKGNVMSTITSVIRGVYFGERKTRRF